MNVTTDKRFLKSKYAIEQAILTLHNAGRTITSMTVSEITKLANVARKTFYLHYVDLNDFLTQFGDEQIAKFKTSCLYNSDDLFLSIAKSLVNLTKNIANNNLAKLLITNQQYASVFLTKLHSLLKDFINSYDNSPFLDEYEVEFFTSGIISTYQYWIKTTNYSGESPKIEEDIMLICNRISQLFKHNLVNSTF